MKKLIILISVFLSVPIAFADVEHFVTVDRLVQKYGLKQIDYLKNLVKIAEEHSKDKNYKPEKLTDEKKINSDLYVSTMILSKKDITKFLSATEKGPFEGLLELTEGINRTRKCISKNPTKPSKCFGEIECKTFGRDSEGLYFETVGSDLILEKEQLSAPSSLSNYNVGMMEHAPDENSKKASAVLLYNVCMGSLKIGDKPRAPYLKEDFHTEFAKLADIKTIEDCADTYEIQRKSYNVFVEYFNRGEKHFNTTMSVLDKIEVACKDDVQNTCKNVTLGSGFNFFTLVKTDCSTSQLSERELKQKLQDNYLEDQQKEVMLDALGKIDSCKQVNAAGYKWRSTKKDILKHYDCRAPVTNYSYSSQSNGQYCTRYCSTGKACGNSCIARWKNCYQPPGSACDI